MHERLAAVLLRGLAWTLALEGPVAGAVALAVYAMGFPHLLPTALAGLAAATLVGWAASEPPRRGWEAGLTGFNGAIIGLVWPFYFDRGVASLALLAATAAASALAVAVAGDRLSRRGRTVPLFTVPTTLLFAAVVLLAGAEAQPAEPLGLSSAAASGAVLLAMLVFRPAVAAAAVAGMAVGVGLALAAGGWADLAWWAPLYAFTCPPAAVGIALLIKEPGRWQALAYAAFGALVAGGLWFLVTVPLAAAGIPGVLLAPNLALQLLLIPIFYLPRRPLGIEPAWPALSRVDGAFGPSVLSFPPPPAAAPPLAPVPAAVPAIPAPPPAAPEGHALRPHGEEALERAAALLVASRRVVALTGAGLSVESGIPDMSSPVWRQHDVADLVRQRILTDPGARKRAFEVCDKLYRLARRAVPSAGHIALARMEAEGLVHCIATQNVDGLHQAAGSAAVLDLHGQERDLRCVQCGLEVPRRTVATNGTPPDCPRCAGILRSASVLYGDPLPEAAWERARGWFDRADLVLVLGTSLHVPDVAALALRARSRGAAWIHLDVQPTPYDIYADIVLRGLAGDLLPRLCEKALALREAAEAERDAGAPAAAVAAAGCAAS